jgi:hypothetical protein
MMVDRAPHPLEKAIANLPYYKAAIFYSNAALVGF